MANSQLSLPGCRPSARDRTESATVRTLLRCEERELASAHLANPQNSPVLASAALHRDEQLSGLNQVSPLPVAVTAMAGRNEVIFVVVQAVVVDVVNGDDALASSDAPIEFCAAPMARVWSGADLVPEDKSMFANHNVIAYVDAFVAGHGHSLQEVR